MTLLAILAPVLLAFGLGIYLGRWWMECELRAIVFERSCCTRAWRHVTNEAHRDRARSGA